MLSQRSTPKTHWHHRRHRCQVNEVLSDAAVLKRQAKEIEDLRRMLEGNGCGAGQGGAGRGLSGWRWPRSSGGPRQFPYEVQQPSH